MHAFSVYKLTPSDVLLMRSLNALFGEAFGDAETYGAEPPSDSYLQGLFARDHVIVLVALVGGEVAGGLVAYELDKFERARREVYIYDLAVDVQHRRCGIATALKAARGALTRRDRFTAAPARPAREKPFSIGAAPAASRPS